MKRKLIKINWNVSSEDNGGFETKAFAVDKSTMVRNIKKDYVVSDSNGIYNIAIDLQNESIEILFHKGILVEDDRRERSRIMSALFNYTDYSFVRRVLYSI